MRLDGSAENAGVDNTAPSSNNEAIWFT